MDATTLSPTESLFSTYPIHTLPPELLIDIFLHLYKDPSVPRAKHDLHNTHKLTFIMLVCKSWKDIVEGAPILWTDIWLGRCPQYIGAENTGQWLDFITTRFGRSGKLLLNLTIMAAYVDLAVTSRLLLQHMPRCKALALRVPEDEEERWKIRFQSNTSTVLHRILSSPLLALQSIVIEDFAFNQEWEYQWWALMLDAPNLRDLTSLSPSIIPLKFLSVTYCDHLWDVLRIIDTPNLEHFVVECGLADWPEEVDTVIPIMNDLRELEWYTDPEATDEPATLRHLLHHCPNITSLSYICNEAAGESLQKCLVRGTLGGPILSFPTLLSETGGGSVRWCPELRRLRIACASFERVRELVLSRPMLEHISMQYRMPVDDIVIGAEDEWREMVDMVRWIRSKVQFEFPTNVEMDAGLELREEEGVFWDPGEDPAE
ncbi:hypothetical protein FS837_001725 [Tulasnella sp. UAMH 9824]|nr:hypothetical protein FS837_001725 [Tulasnella sp. UAMH 9824]